MKVLDFIKEIWKQNKTNYYISSILMTFGVFIIVLKNGFPLEYVFLLIPVSMFMSLIFLYSLSFTFLYRRKN